MRSLLLRGQQFFHQTAGRVFDPDAQAYITAVETADGQALEFFVKVAINDFVVGCKADGIWDAIKASCIMAGARTLTGALVPLKGAAPTNFNFVDGNYNRKTGLKGDGTTKYLDSNRNNNDDPQNSKHLSAFYTQFHTRNAGRCPIGSGGSQGASQILVAESPTQRIFFRINYGTASTTHPYSGTDVGLVAVNRDNGSSITARVGGVDIPINDNSTTPTTQNVLVFARNPALPINYSDGRIAFYSIGENLNLALLDARVTALINEYGAI